LRARARPRPCGCTRAVELRPTLRSKTRQPATRRRDSLLSLRLVIRALRRARLAPLAAAIALFATMPITVSSLLHDEKDDAICNPAVVVHDAAAHRIGAAAAALPDSQHCVLCHTLQSLRAVSAALRITAPTVDARLVAGAAAAAINALT